MTPDTRELTLDPCLLRHAEEPPYNIVVTHLVLKMELDTVTNDGKQWKSFTYPR